MRKQCSDSNRMLTCYWVSLAASIIDSTPPQLYSYPTALGRRLRSFSMLFLEIIHSFISFYLVTSWFFASICAFPAEFKRLPKNHEEGNYSSYLREPVAVIFVLIMFRLCFTLIEKLELITAHKATQYVFKRIRNTFDSHVCVTY